MESKARSRLVGMLGFAMRAGRVVVGTDSVCAAMAKRGTARPRLVLVSKTASDATREKLANKAEFYGIESIEIDIDAQELGRIIGKLYAPATVAITDGRFAEEIRLAATSTVTD